MTESPKSDLRLGVGSWSLSLGTVTVVCSDYLTTFWLHNVRLG